MIRPHNGGLGLVHIYTGNGKGKTTAALGLGLRATGRGYRVLVVQFLKGAMTGELESIARLAPLYRVVRGPETTKFTWRMTPDELAACRAVQGSILDQAQAEIAAGSCDLLILDEILGAIGAGVVDIARVERLVRDRPPNLEIVLTGRDAPPGLLALADYVSEIQAVKHPFTAGIPARTGVES